MQRERGRDRETQGGGETREGEGAREGAREGEGEGKREGKGQGEEAQEEVRAFYLFHFSMVMFASASVFSWSICLSAIPWSLKDDWKFSSCS